VVSQGRIKFLLRLSLISTTLFSFLPSSVYSQSASVDSEAHFVDSLFREPPPPFIPLNTRGVPLPSETTKVVETKSTTKAMLFSALIPGLGQIYTHSYWKLPIIWGLGGYYLYEWNRNNNLYRDYRDQYLASISRSEPSGNLTVKAYRDFYRDQRDSFTWYFGILYFANIVDAYVSASLYDFDVGDDLSVRVGESGRVLALKWRF
jgi:hypothetical protein